MSSKLDEAVASARRLPESHQDAIAAEITRRVVEREIALGEASLAEQGGWPLDAVCGRLVGVRCARVRVGPLRTRFRGSCPLTCLPSVLACEHDVLPSER